MINHKKIEDAITLLLEGIGENTNREGLKDTPMRVANMYEEILSGMEEDASVHLSKTFSLSSRESGQMIVEKDILFHSICEHHLMPFFGRVHIAYIPKDRVVGLSKLARTVEVYARRLQIQEQLTEQIADAVMEHLQPRGVMVMAQAQHLCMTMRGVKNSGAETVTLVSRGCFEEDEKLKQSFYMMISNK